MLRCAREECIWLWEATGPVLLGSSLRLVTLSSVLVHPPDDEELAGAALHAHVMSMSRHLPHLQERCEVMWLGLLCAVHLFSLILWESMTGLLHLHLEAAATREALRALLPSGVMHHTCSACQYCRSIVSFQG